MLVVITRFRPHDYPAKKPEFKLQYSDLKDGALEIRMNRAEINVSGSRVAKLESYDAMKDAVIQNLKDK